MCWIGTRLESNGEIAEKDIIVYKVLYKELSPKTHKFIRYFSPYMYTTYKKGKTYTHKHIKPVYDIGCEHYTIHEGLHFYSDECSLTIADTDNCLFIIDNTNKKTCFMKYITYIPHIPCIAKCKIPKETKYYKNEKGEIVTEKAEIISIISTEYLTKEKIIKLKDL